jgi:hypothetical protein
MDPEVTRELEEQLRNLNEMMSQQTAALTGMARAINDSNLAVKNAGNSTNQLTKAQKENEQSSTQNATATTALQRSNEKYGEVMQDVSANFASAYSSSSNALGSFVLSVLGSQEGFAKYNSTIGGVGDAAFSVGKSFGILGFIIGGLFKVGSEVLQYQTQQADGLLNATDAISRMGAAGTFSVEQIRQMGKGAGLSSLELEKLTKPMQSVEGGFVALGGTTSEGIKKFGEMTAVSEDVRREFKRLGMGDQERNQALADFVTMMNKSGTAVSGNLATQGGLQKAALAYTRNLYELAEMTGKDVETAKKERETQMATMEVALQKNKWESERINAQKRLQNATTEEERAAASADIERIAKEEAGFEQFNNELKQAGLNQDQIAAAQNQYLTGTINRTSSQFAIWGVDMEGMIQKSKNNTLQAGELAQSLKTGFQDTLNTFGPALALAPDAAAAVGGNNIEMIGRTTQQSETDYRNQAAAADANVGANQAGTGAAALDPAQEARNDLTEAERSLRLKIDDLAAQFNPLLGNMGGLKALAGAAIAAGAVLAVLAAGAAGAAVFSGGKSLLQKVGGLFGKGKTSDVADGGAALAATGSDKATQELQQVAGGSSIEVFLRGITDGFSAAGKQSGNVVKGGAALAAAIVAIGAGVAGATWILGKSLPTLAEGLTTFNEVDGENLKPVGLGMAGLGAGLLAMGGSKVLGSLGNLVNFFTEEKDPLDTVTSQVLKMQDLDFNKDKVIENSDTLIVFSKAMAKVSALGAKSGIGSMVQGMTEGITSFFNEDPPYQDVVAFSNLDINEKQTKKNATAFKIFSEALSSYEGLGSGLGAISTALADSTAKFFGVKPPLEKFVYFSHLNINPKKADINSKAFVAFSNAMASYRGGPGLIDTISTLAGAAFGSLFGLDGPIEAFGKFANKDFGPNAAANANAFLKYAQGVGLARQKNAAAAAPSSGADSSTGPAPSSGAGAKGASSTPSSGADSSTGPAPASAAAKAPAPAVQPVTPTPVSTSASSPIAPESDEGGMGESSGTEKYTVNGQIVGKKEYDTFMAAHPELSKLSRSGSVDLSALLGGTGKINPEMASKIQMLGLNVDKLNQLASAQTGLSDMSSSTKMPGSEMKSPLNTNSVLMKLAKTTEEEMKATAKTANASKAKPASTGPSEQGAMNLELYNMITGKVSKMLDILENTNSTTDKRLKVARA